MKKLNISIFLNYKKSKNIFVFIKQYIQYYQLKRKLRKIANRITFKEQYGLLTSSNQKLGHYFCFSTNDLSIVIGNKATWQQNKKLLLELKGITRVVYFPIQSTLCKAKEAINSLFLYLKESNGGIYEKELFFDKDKIRKEQFPTFKIYPNLVEESLTEIEKLFKQELDPKRKRFLVLKILGKDFSLIEKILITYKIDKYVYFSQKQELIEYGYDADQLMQMYVSFFEQSVKEN